MDKNDNVFDFEKYKAKKDEENDILSLAKLVLDDSDEKEEKKIQENDDEPIEPYVFKMSFEDEKEKEIIGETEFLFYDTACFLEDAIDQDNDIAKTLQDIIIDIVCENIDYDDIISLSTENIATIYNLFSVLDSLFESSEIIEDSDYKDGYIDALNHTLIAMSEAMSYSGLNEVISHYISKKEFVDNNKNNDDSVHNSNVIDLFDRKK